MNPTVNAIQTDDLNVINNARTLRELAVLKAQIEAKAAELADSQYQVVIRDIFIKYSLSMHHNINFQTGEITSTLPPQQPQFSDEVPAPMVPVSVSEIDQY